MFECASTVWSTTRVRLCRYYRPKNHKVLERAMATRYPVSSTHNNAYVNIATTAASANGFTVVVHSEHGQFAVRVEVFFGNESILDTICFRKMVHRQRK
jgi:predicted RNA methylase